MGLFRFKQFVIHQERCAMKVGTDGVLLGAWAATGRRMLDIGTGTGLIALMLAQRCPEAVVDGVEIDGEAARQACANAEASPFAGRVNIVNAAIQDFVPAQGAGYDCIVSNPPYFQNALGCPEGQRHMARHTDSLTYGELCSAVVRLLAAEGSFSVVLPFDCKEAFVSEAMLCGLCLARVCAVHTTPRKPVRRYLLTFRRQGLRAEGWRLEADEQVLTDDGGGRSEWYSRLTEDFYL